MSALEQFEPESTDSSPDAVVVAPAPVEGVPTAAVTAVDPPVRVEVAPLVHFVPMRVDESVSDPPTASAKSGAHALRQAEPVVPVEAVAISDVSLGDQQDRQDQIGTWELGEVAEPVRVEPVYRPREPSNAAKWLVAVCVGVALGFVGWYFVRGSMRPLSQALTSLASSLVPASSGGEIRAGRAATPAAETPVVAPVPPPPADTTAAAGQAQQPAVAAVVTPPGRLLVRSTPSAARVFVDDEEYGVTPATLRDLPVRTYRVRVALDGYRDQERVISLTSARPAQSVGFDLVPPPSPAGAQPRTVEPAPVVTRAGVLRIESHPVGANVFVDGQLAGQTPISMSQLSAGTHVVRLELDRHRAWSSPVRIVSGEANRVTASLEELDLGEQPAHTLTPMPRTGARPLDPSSVRLRDR